MKNSSNHSESLQPSNTLGRNTAQKYTHLHHPPQNNLYPENSLNYIPALIELLLIDASVLVKYDKQQSKDHKRQLNYTHTHQPGLISHHFMLKRVIPTGLFIDSLQTEVEIENCKDKLHS